MIEKLLEAYDYAICAGDPEECARQFIIWMNRVGAALASSNMANEHKAWVDAQNSVYFFSDDSSFPAQAESMKAILLAILDRLGRVEAFVNLQRIDELRAITSNNFDLTKLVKLCEELNECFASECFLAVAMLTRSILDHVPPIFKYDTFSQVANNYNGGKSFRESMIHLETSSRKISDQHLHMKIRRNETLPNRTQVNFSNDLDVLLAEIVRIMKSEST
jgi:hypothetical protein